MTLVLYPLLTACLYYLGARAEITRFLWKRFERWPRLDHFMLCSACTGAWYGLVVAFALGWRLKLRFLGLPGDAWYTPALVALCSCVWTPLVAFLHLESLARLSGGTLMDAVPRVPADEAAPQTTIDAHEATTISTRDGGN